MGKSIYGQTSGPDNKGQGFQTQAWAVETTASIGAFQAIEAAAVSLEVAVSTSLVAAVTGTSGAGSMDAPVKATLSASYSSVTASIY